MKRLIAHLAESASEPGIVWFAANEWPKTSSLATGSKAAERYPLVPFATVFKSGDHPGANFKRKDLPGKFVVKKGRDHFLIDSGDKDYGKRVAKLPKFKPVARFQ